MMMLMGMCIVLVAIRWMCDTHWWMSRQREYRVGRGTPTIIKLPTRDGRYTDDGDDFDDAA